VARDFRCTLFLTRTRTTAAAAARDTVIKIPTAAPKNVASFQSSTCKALCSEAESLTEGELAVNKEKKLPVYKQPRSSSLRQTVRGWWLKGRILIFEAIRGPSVNGISVGENVFVLPGSSLPPWASL